MASDRSLAALLRALQSPPAEPGDARLLGSVTGLLSLLSNPLNVTLLTSQLLIAPAIWHPSSTLRTAFQLLGVFNNASGHLLQRDRDRSEGIQSHGTEGLPVEEWVTSVVQGADDKSPRWKHLLVIGGVLAGFEKQERNLPLKLRHNLEAAVVTATNLALEDEHTGEAALNAICLVLGHVFKLLSDFEKSRLNHERLLPVLLESVLFSKEGLHWGYIIGTMDADILQGQQNKFIWSPKSPSYFQAQRILSSPLVGTLGSLSSLTAYCINAVSRIDLLYHSADSLQQFARSLSVQWQQNKLSEVDPSEEALFLHEETLHKTIPIMWQILRVALFSTVEIQSALLGRLLSDARIPPKEQPTLAVQTLLTLRNLCFVTASLGQQLFSQHKFVYYSSIDILVRYPVQAETFLQTIRPTDFGRIPSHPHSRLLDLFFLNTAEHFTLDLSLRANKDLLLAAAAPYVGTGNDPRLVDIFEAAHSVTLAVFSAPQNYTLAIEAIPSYIDILFQVFPTSLSARQFRLAIKTLVQLSSTPGPILAAQPLLGPTIMELVYSRALGASDQPLPPLPRQQALSLESEPAMSEQSALVLTLINALPSLSVRALEDWLPLTADAMNAIRDGTYQTVCRQRFWEVLTNGEMDVVRAQFCVKWWTTRSGREMVLYGHPSGMASAPPEQPDIPPEPMMHGALSDSREKKL